jgi:DNA-binding response OmpR family regulator
MNRSLAVNFSLYKLLPFFLIFFIQLNIQAQSRIEIPRDSNWNITLIEELEIMSDEERQWSAESLFSTSDDLFEPNTADAKPDLHNYWARFELANTTENEQWVSFESYYWDYVTLYFRDSIGQITVIPFGVLNNPNNHKFLVLPQTQYDVLANFESNGEFRREDNINLVMKPTHEFRTPLTVIQGMVETVKSKIKKNELNDVDKPLTLISRNGQKLLRLINEMLDLAKLESGSMDLQLEQTDIIPFIKYLSESFHSFAIKKDINLVVYSEIDALLMDFDPNKVASNSHKHEGTGIGLSLVKELVDLMEGTLHVESTLNKGTTFIIQLPITNQASRIKDVEIDMKQFVISSSEDSIPAESQTNDLISKLPLALIIEDNMDVAYYIITSLAGKYETLHAKNGNLGIEIAFQEIPDIIISDVMMPEKNGFEVCETLKNDQRTSHIPIVLLTAKAKATDEDRLDGLRHGADAYLTKPFNKEELFIRLEKLITLRKSLIQKYSDSSYKSVQIENTNDLEVNFLNKVVSCIEKNIENSNFKVIYLARELGLSESQLYRKVKALTNISTAVFIRSVRLQKAKQLLQNKEFNVAEVSYKVGFTDPSYFSRVFKDEFDCTPSEI